MPIARCQSCGARLDPDARSTKRFCNATCRQRQHRQELRGTAEPRLQQAWRLASAAERDAFLDWVEGNP
jgi:hypothetical protein